MKEIKFAVTSNKNDNRKMIIQAKSWAEELQVPYAPRYENGSLDAMLEDFQLDALLIASKKGPQISGCFPVDDFHPVQIPGKFRNGSPVSLNPAAGKEP